jgi:hypothetical protein
LDEPFGTVAPSVLPSFRSSFRSSFLPFFLPSVLPSFRSSFLPFKHRFAVAEIRKSYGRPIGFQKLQRQKALLNFGNLRYDKINICFFSVIFVAFVCGDVCVVY